MQISEKIFELLENAESEDIFDKAVVGYLLPDGTSNTVSLNTPEDTVFDIASLTKVCPTSTLALSYILEGKLSIDAKVIDFIPELKTNYRDEIYVSHSRPKESWTHFIRTSSMQLQEPSLITETQQAYCSAFCCRDLQARTCRNKVTKGSLRRSA